jgi:hypothetical protein
MAPKKLEKKLRKKEKVKNRTVLKKRQKQTTLDQVLVPKKLKPSDPEVHTRKIIGVSGKLRILYNPFLL